MDCSGMTHGTAADTVIGDHEEYKGLGILPK